jgi:hypothetical protein
MRASAHHVTAPEDRIPLRQKSAYAVGMFVNNPQAVPLVEFDEIDLTQVTILGLWNPPRSGGDVRVRRGHRG